MDLTSLNQAINELTFTGSDSTLENRLEELDVEDLNEQEEEEEGREGAPYFFPPLWLARRSKIVAILKEEQVGSVCDLGCGQGAVLQILSSPANHLDDFPSIYPPSPVSKSPPSNSIETSKERKRNLLRLVPSRPRSEQELHLRRLVGIDVDKDALEISIKITEPPIPREEGINNWESNFEKERWEELRVEIYHGAAFEVYNEALSTGLDAMFATEVLEHLTPTSVNKFSQMILGVYQPRLFIVTTPNHEFNPYFPSNPSSSKSSSSPSSLLEESAHRFPDPTLRTKRVFRDSDHQFEWTQLEFQTWAKACALEHDYTVTFTGVGSLLGYYGFDKPIPFPPPSLKFHPELKNCSTSLALPVDPSQFFATQIAIFTRHYSQEVERSPRSHRATPLPFFSPPGTPIVTTTELPTPPSSSLSTPGSTSNKINGSFSSSPTSTVPTTQKSQKLTSSLTLTPHKHLKTHLHPAFLKTSSTSSSSSLVVVEVEEESKLIINKEILNLMKVLCLNKFQSGQNSLKDYWNSSKELRKLCSGLIGNIIEAVLESDENSFRGQINSNGEKEEEKEGQGEEEEEEDEWDFYLIQGRDGRLLKGDEALGIVWKNYVPLKEESNRRVYSDDEENEDGEQEEEEEESDEEWRARASDFLVDDFDTIEEVERVDWGALPSIVQVEKTNDSW